MTGETLFLWLFPIATVLALVAWLVLTYHGYKSPSAADKPHRRTTAMFGRDLDSSHHPPTHEDERET